jgi:hypothetical protein
MIRFVLPAFLITLSGCENMSVGVGVGIPIGGSLSVGGSVFTTPAGQSANRRVGLVLTDQPISVHIEDARRNLPAGLMLVSRNADLKPSAILKVTEMRQSVAFTTITLGKPTIGDEVVEASEAYLKSVEAGLSR